MVSDVYEKMLSRVAGKAFVSPLRYPGGKRKLVGQIGRLLDGNASEKIDRVIEPFMGGGAVTIAFLESGAADRAIVNDLDPEVADFWSTVFSTEAAELADRVRGAEVTLDEWVRLREEAPSGRMDRAYRCLFMNRTSFSGSLNRKAGPIGGRSQTGSYKIDCRFNREGIASRIEALGKLSDRVTVRNTDFRKFSNWVLAKNRGRRRPVAKFWYLDPPFFHKADVLYRHYFADRDHRDLKRLLDRLDGRYILSYDFCPEALRFYEDHPGRISVEMRYTAGIRETVQALKDTEMVVTNLVLGARDGGAAIDGRRLASIHGVRAHGIAV